ncbi:MAG: hypothetical protein HY856_10750 [Burkholderiales bacterium]|jgi:hypothetical protein|nr:hypothetical protein [Burkholderiales bacterium]
MLQIQAPDKLPPVEVTNLRALRAQADTSIKVTFRFYGDRELRSLAKTPGITDAQFLAQLILEWDGVCDFDGSAVPPSERAIARLLDQLEEGAASQFIAAFRTARAEAARGN